MRRRREDPELRRADILDQATRLIGEHGYHGFTVQELAKRCGLSNPGLLHYFPSKPAVLLAVLEALEAREAQAMAPLVASAMQAESADQARTALLVLLRTMMARAHAMPAVGQLIAALQTESLDPDHPAHHWCRTRESVLLDLLETLLARHVDQPAQVARLLLAMMDGLGLQWLRADQSFDATAIWEMVLARLLPELG